MLQVLPNVELGAIQCASTQARLSLLLELYHSLNGIVLTSTISCRSGLLNASRVLEAQLGLDFHHHVELAANLAVKDAQSTLIMMLLALELSLILLSRPGLFSSGFGIGGLPLSTASEC